MKTEQKVPLSYFTYETPCISILWNGKKQPLGMFKTLDEAIQVVEEQKLSFNFGKYQVWIPGIGAMEV
jgi:hypothetical protein